MAFDNNVSFAGNLTRDPELRFTQGGQAVVNVGVAINDSYKDRDGELVERTSFVDVSAWGQLAENIAESLTSGTRVVVTGKLQQRSWETDDGDKRSKVEVVADEISPSLKWATVDVTKNEKGGSGKSSRSGGAKSSGKSSGSRRPARDEYDSDEEPF